MNVGDLRYQLNGTEAYVAGFATSEGVANVVIPETIESDGLTFRVTKINDNAFSSKSAIISVISDGYNLTHIGSCAFYNCSNLQSASFISVINIVFS